MGTLGRAGNNYTDQYPHSFPSSEHGGPCAHHAAGDRISSTPLERHSTSKEAAEGAVHPPTRSTPLSVNAKLKLAHIPGKQPSFAKSASFRR